VKLRALWGQLRLSSQEHLFQALSYGLGAMIASAVVCYVLVAWWPSLWWRPSEVGAVPAGEPPQAASQLPQAPSLSEQLAFAQVYTGFVAILLTAGLGVYAIKEFAERLSRPRLLLTFSEPYLVELARHAGNNKEQYLCTPIVLENVGSATAFDFRVQVLLGFLSSNLTEPMGYIDALLGEIDDYKMYFSKTRSRWILSFRNSEITPILDGTSGMLCNVLVPLTQFRGERSTTHNGYVIYCEGAPATYGTASVTLIRPHPTTIPRPYLSSD
jgi:hypothetical protein